jgi:cytochrome c oxidase assembly factor CtaG
MSRRLALPLAALVALALPAAASAHGGAVPVDELQSAWRPDAAPIAAAAVALALYAQAWVRLRRRGRRDHADALRALLFVAGVGVIVGALVSPLDAIGEQYLLSAHMLQHVLIADAGPALVALGLRGPIAFFCLPPPVLRPLARLRPLRRAIAWLLRPTPGFAIWIAAIGLWHIPVAYDYVLTHRTAHDLEHVSFLVAGLLMWMQLVDPARRRELGRAGRLALAGGLYLSGLALGDTLLFSFHPLYPSYVEAPARLFGLTPTTDQRLAGAVMMVEQTLTLGPLVWYLLLKPERRRTELRTSAEAA